MTRPEPGASATASRLVSLGHEPVLAPCLEIVPRPVHLPENVGALIVTSGQAIPPLPARLHGVPTFCVGDATANRARAAGFCRVESAGGDAGDLFRLVCARRLPGTHVMAVGERQGLALARQLHEAGISVLRRKVYAARPLRVLPADIAAALAAEKLQAALFYSAETARAFVRLRPRNTASITAYALSPVVASGLDGLPWAAIRVAVAPTEADLMALL
ncbi:uroporphyrinogen-III synthase [Acidocella sp.]|uniref:uroporphyrinogen-III synthase n=1 Tax=Acidocella sp. TaxID=50710 RepID=UPI002F40C3DC